MLFTLILAASAAFTINVVSVVAYYDQDDNKYYGLEPVNEQLKSLVVKQERKEENNKIIQFPVLTSSYNPRTNIITNTNTKPVQQTPAASITVEKPKPKRTPIKVIHDDWFMKHYDRICELEAISHRSVLDMFDHEEIFKQFSDLKLLARNLAWEQQQQRVRAV